MQFTETVKTCISQCIDRGQDEGYGIYVNEIGAWLDNNQHMSAYELDPVRHYCCAMVSSLNADRT